MEAIPSTGKRFAEKNSSSEIGREYISLHSHEGEGLKIGQ